MSTSPSVVDSKFLNLLLSGKKYEKIRKEWAAVKSEEMKSSVVTAQLIAANKARAGKPTLELLENPIAIPEGVDIQGTIDKFGYDPRYLKPTSTKLVVISFPCCGVPKDAPIGYSRGRKSCSNRCKGRSYAGVSPTCRTQRDSGC
jgi:hypothetical protein